MGVLVNSNIYLGCYMFLFTTYITLKDTWCSQIDWDAGRLEALSVVGSYEYRDTRREVLIKWQKLFIREATCE